MRIAVVGAGHAGVEAARTAAEAGAEVHLFSAERVLPYFRPRLPAVAFGHEEPQAIQMRPPEWYDKKGIQLSLNTMVEAVDCQTLEVVAAGVRRRFDGIVLALGAEPIIPPLAAGGEELLLPLWCLSQALTIRAKVKRGGQALILGGGILGIEAALRAQEADMTVTVVERLERLMPAQFGARASAALLALLQHRGITVLLQRTATRAALATDRQRLVVYLDDGQALEVDLGLVSIGARPATALATAAGLVTQRGIRVDAFLQTSAERVFAAGDTVQFQGVIRCAAREAAAQGRQAGANLVAALQGRPLLAHAPDPAPLAFKAKGVELYALGEPAGEGSREWFLDTTEESALRALVLMNGVVTGVQMVGTREDFDQYAEMVRQRTGYQPPLNT
jgi:NAD(P)H-nitrite reductase large subunit